MTIIPPSVKRTQEQGKELETFAGKAKLRFENAGELMLPSTKLAVGDPEFPEDMVTVDKRLDFGPYPVVLTIATYPDKDERIAAARLKIDNGPPVKWQEAKPPMIGIDSGVACFVDADLAKELAKLKGAAKGRYWQKVSQALDRNYADTRTWASVRVDEKHKGSMVAFSSGFGDGGFGLYWDFDKQGKLLGLLLDFGVLLTKEEIEEMGEADL
jgi:hypothetical protein